VRQDFACHTSGWPREIQRGLLAAPRDLGGPLAGAADLVKVERKWRRGIWSFFAASSAQQPYLFRAWWVSPAEPVTADTLKMGQGGQQKSLAGHLWA